MGEEQSRPLRLLVVEDNPADVELLRWALKSADAKYELTVISDGGDALAYARQPVVASMPDLAVLDLNLPKNDGVDVLEAMRANPVFAGIPVAVLSSSTSPKERASLDRFHVGRYIAKPPDLDEYLKIGSILKEFAEEGHPSPVR